MPFYYRGKKERRAPRSHAVMRVTTLAALLAYPAGCLCLMAFPDITPEPGLTPGEITGYALILLSVLAFGAIAPSWLQRIVGEETRLLDEFELDLRRRAYVFSYQALTAAAAVFVFYMAVAIDFEATGRLTLWTPAAYDHWNAIFWGVLLYAFVLPTAWLAFAAPAPLCEADDAAA